MSSPSVIKQTDIGVDTKPTGESNSSSMTWRTCVSSSGRLYYYNESTGLSQWKKPAELGSSQKKQDKIRKEQVSVGQEGSVDVTVGSNHRQEANMPEKEKSSQVPIKSDALTDRENLASTLVNMALQSKLDLHAPDVLTKALSLLGKESAETLNKVDSSNAEASYPASDERLVDCRKTVPSQSFESGVNQHLSPEISYLPKYQTPQPASANSGQSVPSSSYARSRQGNLTDHLFMKRPLPNSLLDIDDNIQVPEVLRNLMNEESISYINSALEYLPPDNMLIEADHLSLERQRVDFQLCYNRVKLMELMQKQRALEAEIAVLREKIAFDDFVASGRKKAKLSPQNC
ncbi:WW domain containing protein [Trichuris trichiura]|uniref:WW domain containing protein n=1 Tax=Trichuris trichiura TaxID=36087 RepID=A0A077Z5T5_TRITR|nr:WW domain containing protein [Trichuris trichiura]